MATAAPLIYNLQPAVLADKQIRDSNRWFTPQNAAFTSERQRKFSTISEVTSMKYSIQVATRRLPPWVEPVIKEFDGLLSLPPRWDSYSAKQISRSAIQTSLNILTSLMGEESPTPSIIPLSSGGIQLEWHRRKQDLEISVNPDNSAEFFFINRFDNEVDEGFVSSGTHKKLCRIIEGLK